MSTPEVVDNILTHHGTKGMKWGVRRKATVGAQEVIISDRRLSKKLKTTGGGGHPAHADAVRARTIGQVGKKSGLKALSNKELQDYNQRLNLEMQASRLRHQDSSAAKRFIKTLAGKKVGPAADAGAKAALSSTLVRKKIATGAAAVAIALP